jgi:hypothetical protein
MEPLGVLHVLYVHDGRSVIMARDTFIYDGNEGK